jgi:hypothetical protein
MNTQIQGSRTLFRNDHPADLTDMLYGWLAKLGQYSALGALPALLLSSPQNATAVKYAGAEPAPTRRNLQVRELTARCNKPPLLRRDSEYRMPHQAKKEGYNLVSALAGGENCPGLTIPGGSYTSAAPYVDSGDTTGSNNTVTSAGFAYYCYSGVSVAGPDHVYQFTLAGLGANPRVEVSANSPDYTPYIYILGGSDSCPTGINNTSCALESAASAQQPGGTATLRLFVHQLNYPLFLFVDGRFADSSGPYTLRLKDAMIAPFVPGPRKRFDFDGDRRADLAVFRPSDVNWYLRQSTAGIVVHNFGDASDRIVPADYDGDNRTDVAVFRPSTGFWYLLTSGGTFEQFQWGGSGDIPVPGDFDGDQKADLALFRPPTGEWFVLLRAGGVATDLWGAPGDVPLAGDFDADGRSDFAIFRPSDSTWYLKRSSQGFRLTKWGQPGDIPVPGDYDGDLADDLTVWRPSTGEWWTIRSFTNGSVTRSVWGESGDIPVPADYDGDGKFDTAVFRNGVWYVNRTSQGITVIGWGRGGDDPIPAAFVP